MRVVDEETRNQVLFDFLIFRQSRVLSRAVYDT